MTNSPGEAPVDIPEEFQGLEGFTPEERESLIFISLTKLELENVEPAFFRAYEEACQSENQDKRMRADVAMSQLVEQLTMEGRIDQPDLIRSKAKELSEITDGIELWREMASFAYEHRRRIGSEE